MHPKGLQSIVFILVNMFITNIAFKSPVSNLLCSKSETYWQAMELALFRPWFMVSYRQTESDNGQTYELGRTIFLADVQSVEGFVSQECGELLKFDAVQIVTPGHMNGTTHWKMEVLRAVWSAPEPDAPGHCADVFETNDGFFYSHSMLGTAIDGLKDKAIRFIAPTVTPNRR